MSNVVRLSDTAYSILMRVKDKQGLATVSDAVVWMHRESEYDRIKLDIEAMKKQIAYLLEQVGGAGEDDQTRE